MLCAHNWFGNMQKNELYYAQLAENNRRISAQRVETIQVQKTRNYGVICQMGGFDPAGTPNTGCHPLGLVTTLQNAFWTSCETKPQVRERKHSFMLNVLLI